MTEVAPNRLSEAKMSSSPGDGSTLVLLLSFFPPFVDTGSFGTGAVETSERDGGEGEGEEAGGRAGSAKLGNIGPACVWLDLSGGGNAKAGRLGLGPGTSPPSATPLSSKALWAACCLAALDWGLL